MSLPTIITYSGSRDAIRFGSMAFPGRSIVRSFLFDRLSGSLRLFRAYSCVHNGVEPDDDPKRLALAKAALLAREPIDG